MFCGESGSAWFVYLERIALLSLILTILEKDGFIYSPLDQWVVNLLTSCFEMQSPQRHRTAVFVETNDRLNFLESTFVEQ